jgi:hypothetical protein
VTPTTVTPTTVTPTTVTPTTVTPTTVTPTTVTPTTVTPTTATPTTVTPTTAPPTGTTPTTAAPVSTAAPGVLVRTGANLQPLAVLSGLSIVLGILMLIGSGRPITVGAQGGSVSVPLAPGTPEKWGPVEIAKTIWAGLAALLLALVKLAGVRRGRGRRGGG